MTPPLPSWFPLNPYPKTLRDNDGTLLDFNAAHFAYQKAMEDISNAYTIRAQASYNGAEPPVPHWFPANPYPIGMTTMTDQEYVRIVPDTEERTGISWMLMSFAYRIALRDVYAVLRENDSLLRQYHEVMAQ